MIATWPQALWVFSAACLFFTGIGLPLARALRLRAALALAPALGWAVFSVLALPALRLTGFALAPAACLALAAVAGAMGLWRRAPAGEALLPPWFLPLCAALAWLPAAAVMPKFVPQGVLLSQPMFDHVKIAVVDTLLREGLPVANPFFGAAGRGTFGYYYLWHIGTAVMALLTGANGWSAEAGMTAFTAFASLALVGALAARWGGGARALAAAPLLLLPGSVRPLLTWLGGGADAGGWLREKADLFGWLNQAAWVPQHLAGACCVLLALLLLQALAEGAGLAAALCLGLMVAAGFDCSIWVGGLAFGLAAPPLAVLLLVRMQPAARWRFLLWCALAALVAVPLMAGVAADEWAVMHHRAAGGIAAGAYPLAGTAVPAVLRPVAGILLYPAFLVLMFPALLPPVLWRLRRVRGEQALLLGFAALCLLITAFLRSTLANNDLGWRACLPAVLVLGAAAACAVRTRCVLVLALAGVALGAPDMLRMLHESVAGEVPGDPAGFAAQAQIWPQVRAVTAPEERIATNPQALHDETAWPVNIGWATLSDRKTCYANWGSVVAYGALSHAELDRTEDAFRHVFAGSPQQGDLALVRGAGCVAYLVTGADGAWAHDPFAAAPGCRLAASGEAWRLYRCAQ